ncbi:hypothetical protein P3W45_000639 [Vairimorpha bombi]|jgi:hypothetical protein
MFKTENPQKFFKYLKNLQSLRVYVHNDVVSLCSLKIFTTLLVKEVIKHEIIFTDTVEESDLDLTSEYFYICEYSDTSDKENESNIQSNFITTGVHNKLINNKSRIVYGIDVCACTHNKMDLLIGMYKLIKCFNSLDENALWAVIVGFTFYKMYLYKENIKEKDEDSEDEEDFRPSVLLCTECTSFTNSLCIEVRNLSTSDRDGIFFENSIVLPLLKYSNIFQSLKNDIFFISKYKLIYKKRKDLEDVKIKGYLARKGISLVKAFEKFNNLDHDSKKYIQKNTEKSRMFIRKMGHTSKMSALDCYLLMCYYIFKNKSVKAYLLLDKTKFNVSEKHTNFLKNTMAVVKESLSNVSKIQNLLIFKITKDKIENLSSYIEFVYNIIGIYMRERYARYEYILIIDKYEDGKILVYGYNVRLGREIVNGIKEFNRRDFYQNIMNR